MMFTDWTAEDPRYFYLRGVVYGFVFCLMLTKVFIPIIIMKWNERKKKSC
jgi:hypothetical protein